MTNKAGLAGHLLSTDARSDSDLQGVTDDGAVWLSMDHPLVKSLHKAMREKQEAREREERRYYVDPRDIRFVMGGR